MKKEKNKNNTGQQAIKTGGPGNSPAKEETGTLGARKYKIEELLHELQVYQVELEMQNDELRISRETIEKERMRFSNLFNLAPVGYLILDRVLVIRECNDAALDLLDSEKINVLKKRFLNFVVAEDYDTFYSFISKLIYSQKRLICEVKLKTRSGRIFHGLVEGNIIYGLSGSETSYYFAIIDITEKKVSELEQTDIKERLEMALRASSTGTLTIQAKTMTVKLDSFALEIFRLNKEDFNGKFESFLKLIYVKNRKRVEELIRAAMTNGSELNIETQALINGENRDIEVKGHLIGHGVTNYFAGIITDITERKKLEDEAARLKASHHINILNAVIEAQESERSRISSALHDSVGQLLYATSLSIEKSGMENKSIKKASRLLNEAIRETRSISFELAPSILSDYGLEVALKEMIKRISVYSVKIQFKISGFNKRLQATCELFLFRVVQELLNNIVRHSKASDGIVEITKKADGIYMKIKDNGRGIEVGKPETFGTGLSSIRNRVEIYNGKFQIISERDKGTTIMIYVPGI